MEFSKIIFHIQSFNIFYIVAWTGTISYLIAYFLLSINKIKSDSKLYHALNIIGAIGLIFNALHFHDYPNLVINIAWLAIALIAIFLIVRKRRPK